MTLPSRRSDGRGGLEAGQQVWLPFGKRSAEDISFPLRPVFDAHGIGFVHAAATAIDPVTQMVTTTSGRYFTTTW